MTSISPVAPRGLFYAGLPLAGGGRDTGRLCNAMQWANPICIALASSESSTLQDNPDDISNLFQAIESVRSPVFIRIGLTPNSFRTTVAQAITNAEAQMSYYNTLFLNLGLSNLLAGFWFEWDSTTQFNADASRFTNANLNTLITLVHGTYHLAAVIVCSTPGLIFSPSTGPFSQTYPNPTAGANTITLLGANSGYSDWIVFKNPFFDQSPIPQPPPLIPPRRLDISRYMGMLALASKISTGNLYVTSVQCMDLLPYVDLDDQWPSDQTAGIFVRPGVRDSMINMVNFSRFCGLSLSFACDSELGRMTNSLMPNYVMRNSPQLGSYPNYATLLVGNSQITVSQAAANNYGAHTATFNSIDLSLINYV